MWHFLQALWFIVYKIWGSLFSMINLFHHIYAIDLHQETLLFKSCLFFFGTCLQSDVSSYVSKFCAGHMRIHVCLFTREDEPLRRTSPHSMSHAQVAPFLRNLAHSANGRFRWITDTGNGSSWTLVWKCWRFLFWHVKHLWCSRVNVHEHLIIRADLRFCSEIGIAS